MTETEKHHDAEADDALHDELKQLRKERHELRCFLRDARAFITATIQKHPIESEKLPMITSTLLHDMSGLLNNESCFLPRVSGYSKYE